MDCIATDGYEGDAKAEAQDLGVIGRSDPRV